MRQRNVLISVFVVLWLALFHYESLREGYLRSFFRCELPKCLLLFPPAGWIMFYQVPEAESHVEIYGKRGTAREIIDPHRIFANRWIGYDNIRRNILISVLDPNASRQFCDYLKRKFPEYDGFEVTRAVYPSNILHPGERRLEKAYGC